MDESGQAVIEYFLLLIVVISVAGTMKAGIKKLTVRFWGFLGQKIAAPCASCSAGANYNL